MIALIRGILIRRAPDYVVIDVNGVGYRLVIPLSTFYQLPEEGSVVSLRTFTCVREDSLSLYGFMSDDEKELFEKLIGVTKIGPRQGINLLSGMAAEELREAIAREDVARISSIPGVGVKTAERLILELRDKLVIEKEEKQKRSLSYLDREVQQAMADAVAALINLGYRKKEAEKAVQSAWKTGERDIGALIKQALMDISR